VCDEKSNEMPKMSEELSGPLRQMQVSGHLHVTLGKYLIDFNIRWKLDVCFCSPVSLV
jgi:hypothetical protein